MPPSILERGQHSFFARLPMKGKVSLERNGFCPVSSQSPFARWPRLSSLSVENPTEVPPSGRTGPPCTAPSFEGQSHFRRAIKLVRKQGLHFITLARTEPTQYIVCRFERECPPQRRHSHFRASCTRATEQEDANDRVSARPNANNASARGARSTASFASLMLPPSTYACQSPSK